MITRLEQKQWLMQAKSESDRRIHLGETPNYHALVVLEGSNIFRFSIQIYDSPDGDTWWYGKFRMINDIDIELLESRYETDGINYERKTIFI